MSNPIKRIPKVGDRVSIAMPGTFEIIAVSSERTTVDVKLLGPVGQHEERDVSWGNLIFLDDK